MKQLDTQYRGLFMFKNCLLVLPLNLSANIMKVVLLTEKNTVTHFEAFLRCANSSELTKMNDRSVGNPLRLYKYSPHPV